jgi:hypothetical protein
MNHTLRVVLSTTNASVENGSSAAVTVAPSAAATGILAASLSEIRPTTSNPRIPVMPLAISYCRPTSPEHPAVGQARDGDADDGVDHQEAELVNFNDVGEQLPVGAHHRPA